MIKIDADKLLEELECKLDSMPRGTDYSEGASDATEVCINIVKRHVEAMEKEKHEEEPHERN